MLTSLLEEMKVRFVVGKNDEPVLLSENDFFAKIDKSLKQAESGKTIKIGKDQQKDLLGL